MFSLLLLFVFKSLFYLSFAEIKLENCCVQIRLWMIRVVSICSCPVHQCTIACIFLKWNISGIHRFNMFDGCPLMLETYPLIMSRFSSEFSVDCFRYGSCATSRDFEIYAEHASFEDPLMCAHGYVSEAGLFLKLKWQFCLICGLWMKLNVLWIKIMSYANCNIDYSGWSRSSQHSMEFPR